MPAELPPPWPYLWEGTNLRKIVCVGPYLWRGTIRMGPGATCRNVMWSNQLRRFGRSRTRLSRRKKVCHGDATSAVSATGRCPVTREAIEPVVVGDTDVEVKMLQRLRRSSSQHGGEAALRAAPVACWHRTNPRQPRQRLVPTVGSEVTLTFLSLPHGRLIAMDGRARRVFLSHTAELRSVPLDKSFVAAAEEAVMRARDAVVDMAYFAARNESPAAACRRAVAAADVYVGIIGFRYGSEVRGMPKMSHTELEFHVAGEIGMPRLVFLLGEEVEGLAEPSVRAHFAARQATFRARLHSEDLVTATVRCPAELTTVLLQSLWELPRAAEGWTPVGRGWNVPARNPSFVGRDEVLERLGGALRSGGAEVIQALHGIGGVGKSALVVEYAHRHATDYDIVWWIPTERVDLVPEHLAALARVLGVAPEKEPVESAVTRLLTTLRRTPRWLLIFDNAEDPVALSPFLPGGAGHVVITSRRPDWGQLATPGAVDVLCPGESAALLTRQVTGLTESDAERIADKLGHLPLALAQAGAYLAESGTSAEAYLALLADRTGELLAHGAPIGYPMPLTAGLAIAFEHLEDEHPLGSAGRSI